MTDLSVDPGCCTECGGTGYTSDGAVPGGRCWDCRGTGHPHEGPCSPGVIDESDSDVDENVCVSCGEESDDLWVVPGRQGKPDGPQRCRGCETERLGRDPEEALRERRDRLHDPEVISVRPGEPPKHVDNIPLPGDADA